MSKKYVDLDALSHFKAKADNAYVGKVAGKGLSSNDYTNLEKTKLAGITDGAEPNIIENISVNGTTQPVSGKTVNISVPTEAIDSISVNGTTQAIDDNKNVNIVVPTNNNQLSNGAGYQTASDVSNAIASALSNITGMDYQVISKLPDSGVKGTIYLISNGGSEQNIYDEYIWVNSKFEKIGTTAVDLTGYLKDTDLVAYTNAEIDTIFN